MEFWKLGLWEVYEANEGVALELPTEDGPVFALVMGGLFWTVFELATIPMDLIDLTFEVLGGWVAAADPAR